MKLNFILIHPKRIVNNFQNIKIDFTPEKDNEISQFIEEINKFGSICKNSDLFKDSFIIDKNSLYIINIIKWINS